MTKKGFFKCWLLLAMGVATLVFNSCGKEEDNKSETLDKKDTSNPESVIINGVRWATCNVGTPGRFTTKPEELGMFYQWNRPKAWEGNDDKTEWNNIPEGSTWESADDPSPVGYRLPTQHEFELLFEKGKVTNEWAMQNGVSGRKFTDVATGNSIFLPAAGYLDSDNGSYSGFELYGWYWSGSPNGTGEAYYLRFLENDARPNFTSRSYGMSIRSVAEKK